LLLENYDIIIRVSHILKFLRENSEKEELRRQKKEQEKAAQPQPAIPDEMEQRRAKIEELQLRREATLAEDKAKRECRIFDLFLFSR
jgi:hypothetical protein